MNHQDSAIPSSPFLQLLILLVLVLGIGVLFNLLSLGIWESGGLSYIEIQESDLSLTVRQRWIMRVGLSLNHIGMFLIPGIIWCLIFQKTSYTAFLRLNKIPITQLSIWGLLFLCSYPLIATITKINISIPLPEWMQSSNEATLALMSKTLQMDSIGELIQNLILIGLLAAFGEELIFRGIVQRLLRQKWNNPHIAIGVTALIFGLFHMQFERFMPLAFLGLLLGYATYYTGTLWVAVILHFVNNSLQVILLYLSAPEGIPDIDHVPDLPLWVSLSSFLITLSLFYLVVRLSPRTHAVRP